MGELIRASSRDIFFSFDPDIEPIAEVEQSVPVRIETKDCFSGQITSEEQRIDSIDFSRINPATGPIYVKGADRGDALAVRIRRIDLKDRGVVITVPGEGVLGDKTREARTGICGISTQGVEFRGMRLPLRKMIGVIGVASEDRAKTGIPGRHGGNMDARVITESTIVYLPVSFEGALFGMGDLHAVMGDGEMCVAACEAAGYVTLEFKVLKGLAPPWPVVENNESTYVIVSHESLDRALYEAADMTVRALASELEWHDAYMLASMAADLNICQLVDPKKTVRAKIPKSLISTEEILISLSKHW